MEEQGKGFFKVYDYQELEKQELMSLYIGKNADYYLRKWSKTPAPEKAFSWNWAAFFVFAFWVGYRQMYVYLALLVGIMLAGDVAYIFVLGWEPDIRITIVISLLMGAFGNALYYRHIRRKLDQLKESGLESEEIRRRAAAEGGPNWRGILATCLMLFLYNIILGYLTSLLNGVIHT
ncbi:DUF2628 domain-containing protein [Desulfitobacterium sp. PCE1]|uniref:DUF2628 domain-containing protein n=1 Tax=Desulfitobacterium dehalogenans TaxID=36854 RepID=A0A7C7DCC8_9FIRM|nr:DUF2628 domain-containing protein [Desulfitobacterium sp. PCE1]HHY28797.1 DUF2628 domain-containing protein [Desulfitobacterium dehalogenans]